MAEDEKENVKLRRIRSLLNKRMKIEMSDGRVLEGSFVCTDCHQNVILGQCHEYLKLLDEEEREEPRGLGLAMVPGRHIISIHVEASSVNSSECAGRNEKMMADSSNTHQPLPSFPFSAKLPQGSREI